jgi:hypothetical protein
MTREEAYRKISELSCPYNHVRITDCPHCVKEIEYLVKMLMEEEVRK